MSLITDDPDDSPRPCSSSSSGRPKQQHRFSRSPGCSRRVLIFAVSALASLLSLTLILCLTLRPASPPRFALLAATTTARASATDNATLLLLDAAFAARNPNAHATALYDGLQLSVVSYAGAPLSAAAALPPLDQLPQGDVVMSGSLSSPLPLAVAAGGQALLRLRLEGQLRWKVAAWTSGRHALGVDCVAAMLLQPSPSPSSPRTVVGIAQSPSQCATILR